MKALAARTAPDAERPVAEAVLPHPGKVAEAELLVVRAGAAALPGPREAHVVVPAKAAKAVLPLPMKAKAAKAAKAVCPLRVEAAGVRAKVEAAREAPAHPLQVRAVQAHRLQVHRPVARVVRARVVRVRAEPVARAQARVAPEAQLA